MGVPHVTSFCWCMGLEMGAKCVGALHLVASLSLVVVSSLFARSAGALAGTAEDAGDGLYAAWARIALVAACVSVVHVLLALTLLVSVFKRVTAGLLAWVVIMCVLLVGALVAVVALVVVSGGVNGSGSEIFLAFLEGLLFFGVVGYCILCVNSYYLMLKSAEDMEGPSKDNY